MIASAVRKRRSTENLKKNALVSGLRVDVEIHKRLTILWQDYVCKAYIVLDTSLQ